MDTDIKKTKEDKINTSDSYKYFNISLAQNTDVNNSHDLYNVTPIESKTKISVDRLQSLITLSNTTIQNQRLSTSINLSNYKIYSNKMPVFLKDVVENTYNNNSWTTEVLFDAPKRCKKSQNRISSLTKRKSQKYTRLFRRQIVHFKSKHPEKKIRRKCYAYYDKFKRNCPNLRRFQQDLCIDLVLKGASVSIMLKKVSGKKNLLDEVDEIFFKDIRLNQMLEINPSEDTLTRINSESSQNDSIHTKTAVSVVEISTKVFDIEAISTHTIIQTQSTISESSKQSNETYISYENEKHLLCDRKEDKTMPTTIFNTDTITVAVAQINNTANYKYKTAISSDQSQELMLYKENLTSAESFMTQSDTLDSKSSVDISGTNTHTIENNPDETCIMLTDLVQTFDKSSNSDTLFVGNTNSYFKNNSDSLKYICSNQTLTPSSELTNQTEPCNIYFQPSCTDEIKPTFLDTIINVGIFKLPVSNSKKEYNTENSNNVILIDELRKIPLLQAMPVSDKYSKKVIQKSFSVDNEGDRQKNILPNKDTIRSIITGSEQPEKKPCSEEFRSYAPSPDVWEKLIIFLDLSMRRMENSLVQKIGNELKNSLDKFEKYFPFATLDENDYISKLNMYKMKNKTNLCTMESGELTFADVSMQCGLVDKELIDELMSKINFEEHGTVESPVKVVKSKIRIRKVCDSFEVLKPPIIPCTSKSHGDSLLSSEVVSVKKSRDRRHRMRLSKPLLFIKANILIITSVPAFFVSIFLVYNFFVLLL